MPWKELCSMMVREKFVLQALDKSATRASLTRPSTREGTGSHLAADGFNRSTALESRLSQEPAARRLPSRRVRKPECIVDPRRNGGAAYGGEPFSGVPFPLEVFGEDPENRTR